MYINEREIKYMRNVSNKDIEELVQVIRNDEHSAHSFVKDYRALYSTIVYGMISNITSVYKHLGAILKVYFDDNEDGPEKVYRVFRDKVLVFLPSEEEFKQIGVDTYLLKEIYLIDNSTYNKMVLLGVKELSDSNIEVLFSTGKLSELIRISNNKIYINGKYHADL